MIYMYLYMLYQWFVSNMTTPLQETTPISAAFKKYILGVSISSSSHIHLFTVVWSKQKINQIESLKRNGWTTPSLHSCHRIHGTHGFFSWLATAIKPEVFGGLLPMVCWYSTLGSEQKHICGSHGFFGTKWLMLQKSHSQPPFGWC